MLPMSPQTKSLCSVNSNGPGWSPQMNSPAMITAAVGDPGTPSAIIGRSEPTPAAFADACGATMPIGSPRPKFSLFFEYWRATPYERNDAGVAPVPGSTPIQKPMTVFTISIRQQQQMP